MLEKRLWVTIDHDLLRIHWSSLISVLALGAGLIISSYNPSLVLAVVWMAFAIFGVAFLIGFLFGYPRRREDNSPVRHPSAYEDNTSLAQVSDWLTKILLGIGLVEFGSFADGLDSCCREFAQDTGRPGAYHVALSTTLLYGATGILSGFLWTRLRFQHGLNEAALSAEDAQVRVGSSM